MTKANFDELWAFVVIAGEKSFRRSAAKLNVTPSSLSHSMKALETRLDVRLLNRSTRSVSLTEAGSHLLNKISPAYNDIISGIESLNDFRTSPQGIVKINAPRSALTLFFLPHLKALSELYPNITFEITANEEFIDIIHNGFDVGIRLGESIQEDMKAIPISKNLKLAIVASPAYFIKYPKPVSPKDLLGHNCIGWRQINSQTLYNWPFEKGNKKLNLAVKSTLILDDADLMIRAALDGLGVAFSLEEQVLPYIQSGQLESVLDDWCGSFAGFYLYYPSHRNHSAALKAVIDYFIKRI
ncbi:LysR family transcriptional regulator [Acinetobacter calcoaceticus]|uniref:LysR family transcriptional regulator n=1 Tax=Acinetobacter calcoaceticus TaxID=471 RepID=UPI00227415A5|nr:LysR family transcriptional regulator [Acinetobacter calcoaceticus]GLG84202.1 LysR family transcriptional regulator [Acinetobacter calcoaceticus]